MSDRPDVAGAETRAPRFAPVRGELVVALAVLGLAAVAMWQTRAIPASPLYSQVGPTIAPTMVCVGLFILGFGLLYAALRGGWQAQDEQDTAPDGAALDRVLLGLVLNVALISTLGFTASSVLMFVFVSRAFGSENLLRDFLIALVLSLVAYFGFAQALGIDIGRGLVENAIFSLVRTAPGA